MIEQDKQNWYDEMIERFTGNSNFPELQKSCLFVLECVDTQEEWTPYHFNVMKKSAELAGNNFVNDQPDNPAWFYRHLTIVDGQLNADGLTEAEREEYSSQKANFKSFMSSTVEYRKYVFETPHLSQKDKERIENEIGTTLEIAFLDHSYVA